MGEQQRRQAYEVGLRLAAQDRAADKAHRDEMARLIGTSILRTRDADFALSLLLQVHNKSTKVIRRFDAGLEVDAKDSTHRLGLAEIEVNRAIRPQSTSTFWEPVRYLRFGEDSGVVEMAAGKSKNVKLEVTEIKYTDGSDAGYDD